MTELDLDGIEAHATDIANYLRSEPVVFLVGAMHARVSLLARDVRELVAEVRRLRGELDAWQSGKRRVYAGTLTVSDSGDYRLEAPMTTTDSSYTDAVDIEALAATVHQAYLDTCHRLGWPVKPENQVPYSELSEDSKELDRASVRAVLHALTAAGWQPPVRHGDPPTRGE